jgi:hypothetical protein
MHILGSWPVKRRYRNAPPPDELEFLCWVDNGVSGNNHVRKTPYSER